MSRPRVIIAALAFLATFGWLLGPDPGGGPASLWPSALAVGLAFLTRDIYLALFAGALAGALLLRGGDPVLACGDLLSRHLVPALQDGWNVHVILFTLMMGGWVEVLNRNGGMRALADWMVGQGRDRKRAGLGAYAMGWLVFFDGLANAMLVGKTMRAAADRSGLSREKLAFVVDSTASPIAGLALISTWVAYEMSVIRQGIENAGDAALLASAAPYQWLVQSLPYRFYNWFLLLLVPLTLVMAREIGPMLKAEREKRRKDESNGKAESGGEESAAEADTSESSGRSRVWLALVPLTVLVLGVFGGLYVDGGGWGRGWSMGTVIEAFGRADAARVLVLATAGSSLVALVLSRVWQRDPVEGGQVGVFFEGMRQMFLPLLILVFAWMLNGVIKELGAAGYLAALLDGRFAAGWLPALVFLVAATVSFSTGTSWGTMAIVMPLAVPVAIQATGAGAGEPVSPALLASVGAVLAGAVFGDHCSPISDTTIVSAFSSGCDVMAHVRTQLPYALAAAGLAVVSGYAPAGWGVPPWVLLATGAAGCWLVLRYAGGRVDAD